MSETMSMEPPPLPPAGQAPPVLPVACAGAGAGVVLAWVFGLIVLVALDSDLRVQIRAGHEASYSDVTKVLDICQKLGIWNVAFSTLPPEGADRRRDTR